MLQDKQANKRTGRPALFLAGYGRLLCYQSLRYPMRYGQACCAEPVTRRLFVCVGDKRHPVELIFAPGQSILLTVTTAGVTFANIEFDPF